jgi:hypothetical protein
MSFFEGLIVTEDGVPVSVTYIGATPYYVVDDQGFRRHIEAKQVDAVVLEQFAKQLETHRDDAAVAMMQLMGQDDLFTKAMVDSALQHIDLDQVLGQGLPQAARQWLGMMGFRIVINVHGEVVRIDMPTGAEGPDDED